MVREGDILRVASLATLQQEEKMHQAQLKAEQDSRKQEEEGEPLITEYIPVNYSTAKTEVLPHLTSILTKGPRQGHRGRTQQPDHLHGHRREGEAGQGDRREDRPGDRPGGIEARVVEANSSFNREIGFDWGTITIDAFKIGGALKTGPTTLPGQQHPDHVQTPTTRSGSISPRCSEPTFRLWTRS